MDAHVKNIVTFKNPSSEDAYGKWSLEKTGEEDMIPSSVFFRQTTSNKTEYSLTRIACERLLHQNSGRILSIGNQENFNLSDLKFLQDTEQIHIVENEEEEKDTLREVSVIHFDLNKNQRLPFQDDFFDAVIIDSTVGNLRQPIEIFRDVSRILKPEGIFIVIFIHPHFSKNMTRMWAMGDDFDHITLIDSFFEYSNAFTSFSLASLYYMNSNLEWTKNGIPPDPDVQDYVHVSWAYKEDVPEKVIQSAPFPTLEKSKPINREDIRYDENGRPFCPHCGNLMHPYHPPVTVFEIDYGVSEAFVCFENDCDYYKRSRNWMRAQGIPGYTYRFMINPDNGAFGPIPDNLFNGLSSCRAD